VWSKSTQSAFKYLLMAVIEFSSIGLIEIYVALNEPAQNFMNNWYWISYPCCNWTHKTAELNNMEPQSIERIQECKCCWIIWWSHLFAETWELLKENIYTNNAHTLEDLKPNVQLCISSVAEESVQMGSIKLEEGSEAMHC
jgi:hypothetical protein